ncbi:MAG TPA: peptidylprolyl isomerase [Chitinophagaceae bacterium]|jgi:peptidyl-prolyl cis-trans isomerase SurA|nr:peptidylprolyl isomerase [Chitinophagaceae bacterium]
MHISIKPLTALCLLLGFVVNAHAQTPRVAADKVIAVVDDEAIFQSTLDKAMEETQQRGVKRDRCELIRELIVSKLLLFEAIKDTTIDRNKIPEEDTEDETQSSRKVSSFGTAEGMRQKILGSIGISSSEVKMYYDKLPKASLSKIETQYEICQIIVYPKPSKEAEQSVIKEMNDYKAQVESKKISFTDLAKKVNQSTGNEEFDVQRYDAKWDSAFARTVYLLEPGEISKPMRSKWGYHLVMVVSRKGYTTKVRQVFRTVPVTDGDIASAAVMLYKLRSEMLSNDIDFKVAASNYNESEENRMIDYCMISENGSSKITIDQLDQETASFVKGLNPRELSKPITFEDKGGKAVRILYLKSRKEAHIQNPTDEYEHFATMALEEKRQQLFDKWIDNTARNYAIMIDDAIANECNALKKLSNR